MAQRNYSKGTERALYLFSGGFCYYPKCKTPVLYEEDGEMICQMQIAHIRGLHKTSARYDRGMTDEQRNNYKNLILLCIRHHYVVDRGPKAHMFTPAKLSDWKRDREGDKLDALRGIEGLTETQFEQMLINSVTFAKDELLEAIDAIPGRVDERIVQTLKKLVNQNFREPRLDIDAINTLHSATRQLDGMAIYESAGLLKQAADSLQDTEGIVGSLRASLSEFPEMTRQLNFHSSDVNRLSDQLAGAQVPQARTPVVQRAPAMPAYTEVSGFDVTKLVPGFIVIFVVVVLFFAGYALANKPS